MKIWIKLFEFDQLKSHESCSWLVYPMNIRMKLCKITHQYKKKLALIDSFVVSCFICSPYNYCCVKVAQFINSLYFWLLYFIMLHQPAPNNIQSIFNVVVFWVDHLLLWLFFIMADWKILCLLFFHCIPPTDWLSHTLSFVSIVSWYGFV